MAKEITTQFSFLSWWGDRISDWRPHKERQTYLGLPFEGRFFHSGDGMADGALSRAAGIGGCFLYHYMNQKAEKAKLEAGLCYKLMYGTSCIFLPASPHLLKAP